ncbi:MAG: 3-keto-5-aminohexanoate cleavage protein [Pseudomonadota bacterium]
MTRALPQLMVAPNGARLGRRDHPALPTTLPQILDTARSCFAAGADGLHLHLRDETGGHLLDAGAYCEALAALSETVPGMAVQITTEAAGLYKPAAQRALVRDTAPALVSIGLRELLSAGEETEALRLYADCAQAGTAVQHILYDPGDLTRLANLLREDLLRDRALQLLFVLGSHGGRAGTPSDLNGFLIEMSKLGLSPDWAVCCFGAGETHCLRLAHGAGGKLRVGFENNWIAADGTIAPDNASRVAEVRALIDNRPDVPA